MEGIEQKPKKRGGEVWKKSQGGFEVMTDSGSYQRG